MAKMTYIDTVRAFDDHTKLYDLETKNHTLRVEKTTLGAYDEYDTIGIGYGGRVTITGENRNDNEIIQGIYNLFNDTCDYELYLDDITDYNSYINTRLFVDITTYDSPDALNDIIQEVIKFVDNWEV